MSAVRLHARVVGRVQGVGFRYYVLNTAQSFGLTGWVRNRMDHSVELEAEGDRELLDSFLERVRQGPSSSRVDEVVVTWKLASGEFTQFVVLTTR